MTKLTETVMRDPRHTFIYGDSGTGKSTLASLLAYKFKLIWISVDGGHRCLYKLPLDVQENIDLIHIPDTKDAPIAIGTVKRLTKGGETNLCHLHAINNCSVCAKNGLPFSKYELNKLGLDAIVVIDHGTAVSDSCMFNITRGRPNSVLPNGRDLGFYKPQLDDYGALGANMKEWMKDMENAPYNLVCIGQSQEIELEDGSKKLGPNIGSREFGRNVGNHFDNVIYCELLNGNHKFGSMTNYSMRAITKSRDDIAIERLEKPSLVPFYKELTAEQKKKIEEKSYGHAVGITNAVVSSMPAVTQPTLSIAEAQAMTPAAKAMAALSAMKGRR